MTQSSPFRATGLVPLRRLAWRLGRRVYCAARGEPNQNPITTNGEAYVQACVAMSAPAFSPLVVVPIEDTANALPK